MFKKYLKKSTIFSVLILFILAVILSKFLLYTAYTPGKAKSVSLKRLTFEGKISLIHIFDKGCIVLQNKQGYQKSVIILGKSANEGERSNADYYPVISYEEVPKEIAEQDMPDYNKAKNRHKKYFNLTIELVKFERLDHESITNSYPFSVFSFSGPKGVILNTTILKEGQTITGIYSNDYDRLIR